MDQILVIIQIVTVTFSFLVFIGLIGFVTISEFVLPNTHWRDKETGDVYLIDTVAVGIWYGKVPNEDYLDPGGYHTTSIRKFFSKCKYLNKTELKQIQGLQALVNLK